MSWPSAPLASLTSKIGSGATPRGGQSVYVASGVALIRSQNVLDNALQMAGVARITEDAAQQLVGVSIQPGDVLINITGDSIARVARVGSDIGPARVNQHVAIIRPAEGLDGGYLQRVLVNPWMKERLIALSQGGATRKALTKKQLQELVIPVPDLATQTAIAAVLGALDDKIAANEAVLARNLKLSRAIFASLPKPLEVPLSTLARFVNGRNFTKDATGRGRPVIRIAELNNGLGGSTVWNAVDAAEDNVARAGDILFAWSGSLTVVRWAGSEGLINQHIFKVLPSGQPSWLVFHVLLEKLADYKAIAADKATTMGHIQRRHLDEVVGVPEPQEIEAVGARMEALWNQEANVRIENERLAATRDALLPELMSGRLTVSDVPDVRDSL